MSLPSSRNTNYANGVPVEAADLNDLQDAIVAGKHGTRVRHVPATMAGLGTNASLHISGGYVQLTAAAAFCYLPLDLDEGDRIVSIDVFLNETSGNPMDVRLYELDGTTGANTVIDGPSTTPGGGTYRTVTLNAGSLPYTVPANKHVAIRVGAAGVFVATQQCHHAEVTYDHP